MLGATGPQLVVTLGLVPAHGAEEAPPPALLLSSVPSARPGNRAARRRAWWREVQRADAAHREAEARRAAWASLEDERRAALAVREGADLYGGPYPCASHITPVDAIQAGFRVVLTRYPDGGLEATTYWQPYRADGDAPRRRGRSPGELPDARTAANLHRGNQRAKSYVRRVVRQRELRMMWTGTWPDPGQWDRAEAMATLACFLEAHGDLIHGGGPYLAVVEPHPLGHGWHGHVFSQVVRYSKAALRAQRAAWSGLLLARGWTLPPGVRWFRTHAKPWKSARLAGNYAGKYAAKSLDAAGRATRARRYTVSLGLKLVRQVGAAVHAKWHAVLKYGGGRALVAWWRSWDEGEEPRGWPVAWLAWEPVRIRSPDSGRLVA